MCGEQTSMSCCPSLCTGSPPRVRGTEKSLAETQARNRITPACAGNRRWRGRRWRRGQDHPRVCGEQEAGKGMKNVMEGSPPRVRGTDIAGSSAAAAGRITPACAGNSCSGGTGPASKKDHPRVCGEQTKKSPSFLHSFLSDQENSFSLKYNCSISSQSFCARWTSLQGSSKCFAKVDS